MTGSEREIAKAQADTIRGKLITLYSRSLQLQGTERQAAVDDMWALRTELTKLERIASAQSDEPGSGTEEFGSSIKSAFSNLLGWESGNQHGSRRH